MYFARTGGCHENDANATRWRWLSQSRPPCWLRTVSVLWLVVACRSPSRQLRLLSRGVQGLQWLLRSRSKHASSTYPHLETSRVCSRTLLHRRHRAQQTLISIFDVLLPGTAAEPPWPASLGLQNRCQTVNCSTTWRLPLRHKRAGVLHSSRSGGLAWCFLHPARQTARQRRSPLANSPCSRCRSH